jgi:hypothetical protein
MAVSWQLICMQSLTLLVTLHLISPAPTGEHADISDAEARARSFYRCPLVRSFLQVDLEGLVGLG